MLTEEQEQVKKDIINCLTVKNKDIVLLKGAAGVGKTYLLSSVVKDIKNLLSNKSIVCSAPTHKAVAVIKDKLKEDVKFSTVHRELSYRMSYKKGEKVFAPNPRDDYPPLKGVGLWIIDEASMVGEEMLEYILKYAEKQNTKVLFVGDQFQINPVKEDNSPVFFQDFPTFELKEIVRQGKNSPIIKVSRDLSLLSEGKNLINSETEDGMLFTKNFNKITTELAKVNGSDDIKYLAWTNKEVDKINREVRIKIYGDNPAKVEVGESIVFNAPYRDLYTNNEELRAKTVKVEDREFHVKTKDGYEKETKKVTFRCYVINSEVFIIHEDSENKLRALKRELLGNAKAGMISFASANKFLDLFADFKYNHALTVHKSQGSSFVRTIINHKDICKNRNLKERKRLLYTAVTRASKLLIVY